MDNIETFRERLLQDEALQRRLHHQREVTVVGIVSMTTLKRSRRARCRQNEEKKEGKAERKTAMK